MHQSQVLSTLIVSLVLVTPACGSKFVSLGDEDAGGDPVGLQGSGGANPGAGGAGWNGNCVCSDPAPDPTVCSNGSVTNAVCQLGPAVDAQGQFVEVCMWQAGGCPVEGAGGSYGAGGAMPIGGGPIVGAGGSVGCSCSDPAPSTPTYLCPDGSVAGPFCGPNANGQCIWDIRGCPVEGAGGADMGVGGGMPVAGAGATVGAGGAYIGAGGAATVGAGGGMGCACNGPVPQVPDSVCPDGSIAGAFCEPDANGECFWNVRGCPVEGAGGSFSGIGGAAAAGGSTASSATCGYNGVVYVEGQSFPAGDGCNTCYCMPAGVACTTVSCELPLGVGGASIQ